MARTIHIHTPFNVRYEPIDQLVGVAEIRAVQPADAGGGIPEQIPLHGLSFVDVDGETHVYVLTDEAKQTLLRTLTRGIVLPGS